MLELAVVIVNYKTPVLVIDCIKSVLSDIEDIRARVVVVDNHSDDGSAEKIETWLQQNSELAHNVELIQSSINGGFSAGNNLGITTFDAEYYLLLNSDTFVRPGAIKALLNSIKKQPNVGLLGPRLEYKNGIQQESYFRSHGLISEFLRGAGLSLLYKIFSKKTVPISLEEDSPSIDWTSFACILIRKQVFDEIGLMDEGYFMYFEDVEFCHRARRRGWQVAHEKKSRVVHLRGGSSSVKSQAAKRKRLPRYFYESRSRYFKQLGGRKMLIAANFSWLVGRFFSQVKLIFGKNCQSIECEHRDIWVNVLKPVENQLAAAAK